MSVFASPFGFVLRMQSDEACALPSDDEGLVAPSPGGSPELPSDDDGLSDHHEAVTKNIKKQTKKDTKASRVVPTKKGEG